MVDSSLPKTLKNHPVMILSSRDFLDFLALLQIDLLFHNQPTSATNSQ